MNSNQNGYRPPFYDLQNNNSSFANSQTFNKNITNNETSVSLTISNENAASSPPPYDQAIASQCSSNVNEKY